MATSINKFLGPTGGSFEIQDNAGSVELILNGTTTLTASDLAPLDVSARVVDATASTLAVVQATHNDKVITLNRAAGIAVTLPVATGTGTRLRFIVGTTVTSNSTTIKVGDATDVMIGNAVICNDTDASVSGFEAGASDDTVTFNGTTTGGIKGDSVELIDIATNTWFVRVTGSATGAEATPFSATV